MTKKEVEEILKINIFEELGIENASVELKRAILEDSGYVATQSIWIAVLKKLSTDKQDELATMLEENPDDMERIASFIKKEVPDHEDVAREAVAKYKQLLLAH
ncbi:MAG: hypothetical protein K9L98_00015 [Candidatus Pacebacteria bacterium]|nr:hypothetical protein [Candidatus Paceibacterota bacterium]MCF7862388.1 hypothetical protein [Candidatus Paceibacterota bacterium]